MTVMGAIVRKELHEYLGVSLQQRSTRVMLIVGPLLIAFFSVMAYLVSPLVWQWGAVVFIPSFLIFMLVFYAAESYTGERERHTLETVLAGPVTPRTLLWGKVLAQLALLGGGLTVGTLLSLLILYALNPTPTEVALFFLAFPFVLIGSVTLGLMMLLLGNLASVQSPNVKATMPRIMVYMASGFAVGYLPSAVLFPLILGYSQQTFEPPSATVLFLVFALQVLAVLGYFGYLGYRFMRLMKLTREETFKMDV